MKAYPLDQAINKIVAGILILIFMSGIIGLLVVMTWWQDGDGAQLRTVGNDQAAGNSR